MLSEKIASALHILSTASLEELQPHSREVIQVLKKFLSVDNSSEEARRPSTVEASQPSDANTPIQEAQVYLALPRDAPQESRSTQPLIPHQLNQNTTRSYVDESWISGNEPLPSTHQPQRSNEQSPKSQCWPGASRAPQESLSTRLSIERFLTDQSWVDLSVPALNSHRSNVNDKVPPASADWIEVSTSQPGSHQNDRRIERSFMDLSWVDTSATPDPCQSNNGNGWPLLLPQTTHHDASSLPLSIPADYPSLLSLDTSCLSSMSVPDLRPDVPGNETSQETPVAKIKERCSTSDKLWEKVKLNRNVIENYLKHPIDEAVGEPASTYDDIRLVDIECVDGQLSPTFQSVFRKVLAHRSITSQYNGWRGSSQTNGRSRCFSRASFSRNGNFSNPKTVANALRYGLKLERMEKAAKFPTVSILFCVGFWEFKQIAELELVRFIERMETSEPEMWDLLKTSAEWFEDCQTLYSGTCGVPFS